MKLPLTEKYLKKGIKLHKLKSSGFWQNVYEYKTVYDLDEAVMLNANEGWIFKEYEQTFINLTIMLYRDLKAGGKR